MRIFGLDIGTTSIGFAVIEHDADRESGAVLHLGSRIFPEGRNPKGEPENQARRQKRMARRQLRRRRQRRRALNERLTAAGLLPAFSQPGGPGMDAWQETMRADPIALRARALDAPLLPFELGRALYHLAKRRHFSGRELETDTAGKEAAADKAVRTARETLSVALRNSGETLAQHLAARAACVRRRGTHVLRTDIETEFERIWTAQAAHHPTLREPGLREEIAAIAFAQRPIFWRKATLGSCAFVPGAPLCPKGSWLSQQRRMLEKLNNLALVGGNARPLDAAERTAILSILQQQISMSWTGVRRALKPLFKARGEPGREKGLRFNLEEGGEPGLPGNLVEARLADIFGDAWPVHPHREAIRHAIQQRLWAADYDEVGTQRVAIRSPDERRARRLAVAEDLVETFGASRDEAARLADLALPAGWEPFSRDALLLFLPELERGVRFGALMSGPDRQGWRAATFPGRAGPTGAVLDRLPSPSPRHPEELKRIAALRNPTVVRTQNELRKVVNNLIGLYGKPDRIRIELAREVGKSARERQEMKDGLKQQQKKRAEAAADLRSKDIETPSRRDIETWLLWNECGRFDPYSGDDIGFDALFRRNEFEVEHIWPRSRSFDDAFANKTLCRKDLNIRKGNRTPFEAFGHGDAWAAMKARVWDSVRKGRMKPGKAKRFCREEPLDEGFTARQLVDTSHAARDAAAGLKRLWPDTGPTAPVTVEVVTGRVTAQLRRLWQLNNILSDDGEKTRADHRHHAIDALVVACASAGMTQRLSAFWQAKDDLRSPSPPRLDPPWAAIRADAEAAIAGMIVSHRVARKVSGPLHKETTYGDTGVGVVKGGKQLRVYVRRVPVTKLELPVLRITRVEDISRSATCVVRDDAVRQTLLGYLEASGRKAAEAYPPYPRVSANGPEIRTVRVLEVKQKSGMAAVSLAHRPHEPNRRPNGFAESGANHHMAIYRMPGGKVVYEVVSLLEASRRLARREPIVRRRRDDGARFVMSLSPGDAVEVPGGNTALVRIVRGVWANGQIVLQDHRATGEIGTVQPMAAPLLASGARKIAIDPIGRISPARD